MMYKNDELDVNHELISYAVYSLWLEFLLVLHVSDVSTGCEVYNLGTGKGTSVLEMVTAFEKASGKVKIIITVILLFLYFFLKMFYFP